jgi:hypothetical protein
MAIVAMPTGISLINITWSKPAVEQVQRGVGGRTRIVKIGPAERWLAAGQVVPLRSGDAAAWRAFAAALSGRINTFRLPAVEQEQHSFSLTVQASAATAAGNTSLILKNLPVSLTLLPAGRMITVTLASGDEQLIVLTAPLTANASGVATAYLGTPLRENVLLDAVVETRTPWGLMRANNPDQWDVAPGQVYSFRLEAEEAF